MIKLIHSLEKCYLFKTFLKLLLGEREGDNETGFQLLKFRYRRNALDIFTIV